MTSKPFVCGGFHGLSDRYENLPQFLKRRAHAYIKHSTQNLDHIFSFLETKTEPGLHLYLISLQRKHHYFDLVLIPNFGAGLRRVEKEVRSFQQVVIIIVITILC